MNADEHMKLLSGRGPAEGCCPASSCWEAMIQNNTVKAADATAALAISQSRSPLGLSVYAADTTRSCNSVCNTPGTSFQSNSGLLDGLLREISQRQKMVSERPIPWLKWQVPHHLLDSTDVTQLMYCIGRRFQLSDCHSNFYCVSFRLHEVSTERLALFKGLGFNALEIRIPPEQACHTGALAYCASLAEDFHFQHFGIEWQTTSAELYPTLLNTVQLRGRTPESITFKPVDAESESASLLLQTLYRSLTGTGYGVLGNDVFVRPESPLALAQQYGRVSRTLQGYNSQQVMDVLGLGPGNTSTLGGMRMTNAHALSTYLQDSFDHYRQEVVAPGIREVIDQMLCYHQLNLIYFKEQHQLDLEYLFSQLDSPAGREAAGGHPLPRETRLYDLKNNTLSLTTCGVLQLSSLCQALSQLQPR